MAIKPCRICGSTDRYEKSGKCRPCGTARAKKWRKDNPEQYREQNQKGYKENREKIIEKATEWNRENTERRREISLGHRERNREKLREGGRDYYQAEINVRNKAWRDANPDAKNALTRKRQAAQLDRTPEWLTKDQLEEIRDFYTAAEMFKVYTGEQYHVDHIIPLQGSTISGLHVPWNLQVLPAKDNLMKSSKFEEADNGCY